MLRKARQTNILNKNYDYIIIGGTAGGAYLAKLLSDNCDISVCYLSPNNAKEQKNLFLKNKTEKYSHFLSEPIDQLNRRRVDIKNNNLFNPQLLHAGSDKAWADWEISGAQGFSVQNMQRLHDKVLSDISEGIENINSQEVISSQYALRDLFKDEIKKALNVPHLGQKPVGRFGENNEQYSYEDLILGPLKDRVNIQIINGCKVKKVTISNSQATGVIFHQSGGEAKIVRANEEIILCSGSIDNVLTLLRSGIGSQKHLQDQYIDVMVDLVGVGKNFKDSPTVQMPFLPSNNRSIDIKTKLSQKAVAYKYAKKYGYPMPKFNDQLSTCYMVSNHKKYFPDLLIDFYGSVPFKQVSKSYKNIAFSLLVTNLNSKSFGNIELNSPNYQARGAYNLNYYDHPSDIKNMVRAVKMVYENVKNYNYPSDDNQFIGTKLTPVQDYEWEQFIRDNSFSNGQSIGGCALGRSYSNQAVVDHELYVYGVNNLRICDNSVVTENLALENNVISLLISAHAYELIADTAKYNKQQKDVA